MSEDTETLLRVIPNPPSELRAQAAAYFERRAKVDALIARMAEDAALRARVLKDPGGVLKSAGLEPTPGLIEALRDVGREGSLASERLAAKTLWF